jgi:hypothetical protein
LATPAKALDLKTVPPDLISRFATGFGNETEQLVLGFHLQFEVAHCPALKANQMVMVAAKPLCQLVTSDLALAVVERQQPCFLQSGQ